MVATRSVSHSDGHTVRATTLGELGIDDFEQWRELDSEALEIMPHFTAAYLQPANPDWPAALSIRLLIVERDGRMRMIMPFCVVPFHPRLPIPIVSTSDETLTDETFRLYPTIAAVGGADALRAGLASLPLLGLPRLLDVLTLPADGPTSHLFRETLQPEGRYYVRGRSQWPLARIQPTRHSSADEMLDMVPHHRSPATRRKARRQKDALEVLFGSELSVRDRSSDPMVVDEFLGLQAAGWKGNLADGGIAYQITGRSRWMHRIAEDFRSRGQFTAFEIRSAERPIYLNLGFRLGSTVHGLQDAYDEAGAPHGLGNLARTAYINWLAGRGVDTFDPNLFWGYVDSSRIYPDRREHLQLLVAAPGRKARLQITAIQQAKNLSDRVQRIRDTVNDLTKRARGAAAHAPAGQ